jgi:hypothetical protein
VYTNTHLGVCWQLRRCSEAEAAKKAGILESALRGDASGRCRLTGSKVKDLTPLKEMPIRVIELDFDAKQDGPVLRTFARLQIINRQPKGALLP